MTGCRKIILKARKEGVTTLIAALFFLDTVNNPNTESVIIAHDLVTTQMIFKIVRLFYKHLPEHKKPVTQYASKREFYWPELESYFFVGTAGAKESGRGTTPTNLHGSEVAFWTNAGETVAGQLEAVPPEGNIILESTANGIGNYFHTEWLDSEIGESVFDPMFFAWFKDPEYRQDPEPGWEPGAELLKLGLRHGLDTEQLYWYHQKAKALKRKLKQEHPSTPAEAFLSSGNPYFDRDVLQDWLQACTEPVSVDTPSGLTRLRAAHENLRVWSTPVAGRKYLVVADPAEGLDADGDHDYCAAHVVDWESWEQVAVLHGRWAPREFGLLLADLGNWFNLALVVVERNNHGHATLDAMLHGADYPYQGKAPWGGVYCHEEYDVKKGPKDLQKRPGWPTTPKSKYLALDALAEGIADNDFLVHDRATVGELFRYVKLPGGKAGGEAGSHDDLVTALALAAAVLNARPKVGWAQSREALDKIASRS